MILRGAILVLTILVLCWPARAQLSGYGSTSFGYQSNPLHNYAEASDQVNEEYLQLGYDNDFDASSLSLAYVGGLVLFNHFSARNYYEHSLQGSYSFRIEKSSDDDDESLSGNGPPTPSSTPSGLAPAAGSAATDDSSDNFLYFGAKIGARHDRAAYDDYDNYGGGLVGWYRFSASSVSYLRIGDAVDFRNYSTFPVFSNITNQVFLEAATGPSASLGFGTRLGAGVKHYTSAAFDTSRFETRRTFVPKGSGKGKGGSNVHGQSAKHILINPQANNESQLNIALFSVTKWKSGSATATLTYRQNTGGSTRYLAQYATSTVLSQDIYNDYFNYEGPGLTLSCRQVLPWSVQTTLSVELRRDRYAAPALDLTGVETGTNRIDLRRTADLSVSRYTELSGGFGLDLGINASIGRDQSNDAYNDYSFYAVSLQLGIGF